MVLPPPIRRRPWQALSPLPPAASAPESAHGSTQLETFLINFVVEQTGYPPEVVDLDADLEADLGIDSIKKAQLFGELNEHFDIGNSAAVANLSLDDFPTLRHVLALRKRFHSAASHHRPARRRTDCQPRFYPGGRTRQYLRTAPDTRQPTDTAPTDRPRPLRRLHRPTCCGCPARPTNSDGSTARPTSRRFAAFCGTMLKWPASNWKTCRARRCPPEQLLSADQLDELQGLADAVGVPLGNVLAHHFAIASQLGTHDPAALAIARDSRPYAGSASAGSGAGGVNEALVPLFMSARYWRHGLCHRGAGPERPVAGRCERCGRGHHRVTTAGNKNCAA